MPTKASVAFEFEDHSRFQNNITTAGLSASSGSKRVMIRYRCKLLPIPGVRIGVVKGCLPALAQFDFLALAFSPISPIIARMLS